MGRPVIAHWLVVPPFERPGHIGMDVAAVPGSLLEG